MATADLRAGRARATGIACLTTPRAETFTLGLAKFVDATFPILTANLCVQPLGAWLSTVFTDVTEGATAVSLLRFAIEEARSPTGTASFSAVEETRAPHHALRPGATTCTLALRRVHRTLAGAEKVWCMLRESCILTKSLKTSASAPTLVRVIADIQMISVVTHEKLWFVERLERDSTVV